MSPRTGHAVAALLLAAGSAGCARTLAASTGHDHHPAMTHTSGDADGYAAVAPGDRPDVLFMQGMIPHHAQALEMAALVADRGARREVRLMAERIEVSQRDEIAWMRQWLADHGAPAPDAHAGHGAHAGHALMPGMATPDQMAALAAATGPAFDRLFLELMVRHHEGALLMAGQVLAAPSGTAAAEVFRFVADLEADQGAEIDRMQTTLARL